MARPFNDLTGNVFKFWTVIGFAGIRKQGRRTEAMFHVRCECGHVDIKSGAKLNGGRSLGCLRCVHTKIPKGTLKHGEYKSPTYKSWAAMKHRCSNPKYKGYHNWGGRGIKVCSGLLEYTDFVAVIGHRPGGTSIDRIDNDGNYSCGKCEECAANGWTMNIRWLSNSGQLRNTRFNIRHNHDGKSLTIPEWAEIVGIHKNVLWKRLAQGWTMERALATPVQQRRRRAC